MELEQKKYGIADIIKIPFKCAPLVAVLIIVQTLLSGLIPTVQIVVTAYFIDTAIHILQDQAPVQHIYPALFAVVGLIAYMWVTNELIRFAKVRMDISLRETFRPAIIEKRSQLNYAHIENDETWNLISRVSKNPENKFRNAFNDMTSIISSFLRVAGVLVLLFTEVWWAALLIIAFSIPLFAISVKSGKATYEANRIVSKYKRRHQYLTEVLTGREAVNERTLFGFGAKINKLWHEQYETARKIEFKTEAKWFIKMKSGSVLTSCISILVIVVLIQPVISGEVSIGMFMALVNALFGLVDMMSWQLTGLVDRVTRHTEFLKDLSEFAALEGSAEASAPPVHPAPVFQSLEFKNVSFSYPGMEKRILDGLSFQVTAGKHYAFVGLNGAGKTTITKLMTGLYSNYDGQILLNGKDIKTYSPSALKAFFAIVYQDFAKYYITLKDNIAVGDVQTITDSDVGLRIEQSMHQSGLDQVAQQLASGMDTYLGKIHPNSHDVSGGQWQRIAMARAIHNPAPLRILDEPTAALDPLSESRLYEDFEQMSQNKTTIFISHRLGSIKLAEEIFVIDAGRVAEQGDHAQLMQLQGIYAEMYAQQRSWYE